MEYVPPRCVLDTYWDTYPDAYRMRIVVVRIKYVSYTYHHTYRIRLEYVFYTFRINCLFSFPG